MTLITILTLTYLLGILASLAIGFFENRSLAVDGTVSLHGALLMSLTSWLFIIYVAILRISTRFPNVYKKLNAWYIG